MICIDRKALRLVAVQFLEAELLSHKVDCIFLNEIFCLWIPYFDIIWRNVTELCVGSLHAVRQILADI